MILAVKPFLDIVAGTSIGAINHGNRGAFKA